MQPSNHRAEPTGTRLRDTVVGKMPSLFPRVTVASKETSSSCYCVTFPAMSRVLRVAVCSRVTLFETETATDWAAASGTLMTPGQTSLTEGRVPKVVSGGLAGRSILDWDQRATVQTMIKQVAI